MASVNAGRADNVVGVSTGVALEFGGVHVFGGVREL